MKKLLVSIVVIFALHHAGYCSAKKDTIPAPKAISYHFNYDFTALDSVPIDTLLRGFEIYNPAFENKAFNNFLGNLVSPYQSCLFNDHTFYRDFVFAQSTEYDTHQPNSTLYFNARRPYTILTYFANFPGMKDEQKLKVVHTQNVNRNFNVGATFDLNNSIGKYAYQQNTSNSISLFSSYHGTRYSINGNVNWNTIKLTENGGVNDALYESNNGNLTQISTNLSNASSVIKDQSVFICQRFYVTGSYKMDSLRTSSKWDEAVSLIHRFNYTRTTHSFTDNLTTGTTADTSFYANQFRYSPTNKYGYSKTNTMDSVYFSRVENVLQIAVNANQWLKIPAELRFGIKNQIDRINTYALDSISVLSGSKKYFKRTTGIDSIQTIVNPDYRKNIVNDAIVGSLTDRFSKSTSWGASGEYYFTGYKSGDLLLNGDISQSIKHNFIMKLSGTLATTRPGYFLNNYESNHFQWHNDFKQQQSSSVKLGLYHLKRKFFIDARWDNLNNYVYFDSTAKPQATSRAFLVYSLTVSKLIDWGIFHSDIRLTYQKSGNETAISIPEFSGFTSTYLAFNMVNNELKIQLGVDVYYNSKYYANSYSPATSVFYAQSKKQIENNPYTDMFLNIKLKRTRFFFKYEHIDGLLPNNHEYFIPHYPVNPPLLKFGISWTFYD